MLENGTIWSKPYKTLYFFARMCLPYRKRIKALIRQKMSRESKSKRVKTFKLDNRSYNNYRFSEDNPNPNWSS
jgi:hypothetical protein